MYACMSERECVVSPHSRESVWQARQSVCVRERKRERMRERERERERENVCAGGEWRLGAGDCGPGGGPGGVDSDERVQDSAQGDTVCVFLREREREGERERDLESVGEN